jgi:UDP-N-acetylmuramoyl-L-alanyl-D-glutamate--2,6-diaminopimelate ligase
MMQLAQLLQGIATGAPLPPGSHALGVRDLTLDSREVQPGSLFVARKGSGGHGATHAPEALRRGAMGILWEPADGVAAPAAPAGIPVVAVPGLGAAVGRIADRFFGEPSAALRIAAVTGTNGKTTCAYLLAQALERLGCGAGYVGTLGWGRPADLAPLSLTTPDAISMHRLLAALRATGMTDVALEASSIALDQQRLAGVRLHTAAFTNLTHDHLDYHGTMEAYGEAKARLFDFPVLQQMVINVGDPFGRELAQRRVADARLVTAWLDAPGIAAGGWGGTRHLHAPAVYCTARGILLEVAGSFGASTLAAQLIGRFNAENALIVLGCLLSCGVSLDEAVTALAGCAAAPGRMEVVAPDTAAADRPLAVIDYAHTPDALAKALAALREHCRGELWCVFGCGGDRDPGKRPLMGGIADRLADRIIVTDDNPRSEDPAAITRAIVAGVTRHPAQVIGDRGAAIAAALRGAAPGDVVLIAGKGHEDYQVYGNTRRAFSDRLEAERLLREAA